MEIGDLKFHPVATHFNLNAGFKNCKFSERARNTQSFFSGYFVWAVVIQRREEKTTLLDKAQFPK